MSRARHHEAPKAEQPNDSSKFDLSDAETTAAEAPKAMHKRALTAPPIPAEALRPRKRAHKAPITPETGTVASGEIVSKTEEESDYAEYSVKKTMPSHEDVRASLKADEMPVSEEMTDAYASIVEAEKMADDQRAEEAWKKAHPVKSDSEAGIEMVRRAELDALQSKAYEARLKRDAKEVSAKDSVGSSGFTAEEGDWIKKGEEAEARQMAEARATIERGGKGELMIEAPGDIDASVKEAAALFKSGDLSPRDLSVEDYAYLLKERVRIDEELERAGWWKARQLRKELSQILKGGYNGAPNGLDGYEKQIMGARTGSIVAQRAEAGKSAKASGTPAKNMSFWERFRLGKGR